MFFTPGFFSIQVRDGHLYGSLIDILRFGAPLILVSLGMTLVIATGGIDLSVGSVVAIRGAGVPADQPGPGPVHRRGAGARPVHGARGLERVPGRRRRHPADHRHPILMVAGRGLAQLITDGQIITVNSPAYKVIGGGYC